MWIGLSTLAIFMEGVPMEGTSFHYVNFTIKFDFWKIAVASWPHKIELILKIVQYILLSSSIFHRICQEATMKSQQNPQ